RPGVAARPRSPRRSLDRRARDSSYLRLHGFDLLPPALVSPALDLRAEIRVHDALRELGSDHPLAHGDEIQVEVLDRVARRPLVVQNTGADPGDLVRGHGRSDAGA